MKAYVLVGFVILAIAVVCMLSRRQREHLGMAETATIGKINDRLSSLEGKIAESDKKQAESAGTLNSTLR